MLRILPIPHRLFCRYIQKNEPACYACACQVDELIEQYQARPPLKSQLFISKTHKRMRDLSDADCGDNSFLLITAMWWTPAPWEVNDRPNRICFPVKYRVCVPRKSKRRWILCRGRNGFGENGILYRGHVCMRIWPCHFIKYTEEWSVEQKQTVFPQSPRQTQTIYVDGCKVTVRYAGKENPAAVREIKDILLSNVSKKS